MVWRKSSSELDPEDFVDISEDTEGHDNLQGILGRVEGDQEMDRLVETGSLANGPSEVEIGPSDDQGDDRGSDEKSPEALEAAPTEAEIEKEDLDWEPETDILEVLDDPVRIYL